MDESSGAGDSSPDQESIPKVWQCIHCQATVPGIKPGYVPKFCIECGEAQIKCVNPKCNELLFSDKTKICHVCHTPQQKEPQGAGVKQTEAVASVPVPDSDSNSEATGGTGNGGGNHITTGDNPMEIVTDDRTTASAADNSAPQPPPAAQNTLAAAKDQQENQKKKKDGKTPTQTESPDPQNEQSDVADTHLEISTMTSDSDEPSDHEAYHTGDDSDHGTSVDKLNNSSPVSQIDQPLTRLSLKENRKHGLESGPDSDESNPKKKKAAFGDDKPPLSPTARDSAEKDSSQGENHEKETKKEIKETDKPKGGDQETSKSGQQGSTSQDNQSQSNVEVHNILYNYI